MRLQGEAGHVHTELEIKLMAETKELVAKLQEEGAQLVDQRGALLRAQTAQLSHIPGRSTASGQHLRTSAFRKEADVCGALSDSAL